jgi:hypothetical protein
VTFGTATEKVRVLDIGTSYTPSVSAVDAGGQPVTDKPVTFASRATTVATVESDGRITAVAGGDAWVVASAGGSFDSVFVVVPRSASAPVLRTDATTYTARVGDTLFANVILDPRSTPIGAAELAVQINVGGPLTFVYGVPTAAPAPVVSLSSGLFRISLGAANGITSSVLVLRLKLIGRATTTVGWLTLFALDVSGVDGGDLTPQTTSTRLPVIFR